jgi:general stress protein 26
MDICRKYIELHDKIKNIKIAMLTVRDDRNRLRSMPMITMQTECEGNIWFFTSLDSEKVDEIKRNNQVSLTYVDQKNEIYVSIEGKAELVDNKEKMRELWKPVMEDWFTGGVESPNLGLLKIEMQQAEYWNGKNMIQIWDTTHAVKEHGEFPELTY